MRLAIDARNLSTGMNGIARYVAEMSIALASAGADIRLYAPDKPHPAFAEALGPMVQVIDVGMFDRFHGQALVDAVIADKCHALWGPAHRLPRYLPKTIPTLLTIHDMVWRRHADTMRMRTRAGEIVLMRPALERADRIIAVSGATRDDIVDFSPAKADRISVINPGIARSIRDAAAAPHDDLVDDDQHLAALGITRPFVLFVGTVEPRKNITRLAEAFARLPDGAAKLVVAGSVGWKAGEPLKALARLGLNAVRVIGPDDKTLALLYRNCRFLAFPSLHEGFGLPIIEANAFGKPALTSITGSMPEAAGDAAILVDPLDVDAIAEGLGCLLFDEAGHAALAARARANALRFSWDNSAHALIKLAKDLI